jgi:hypothetical protein
MKQLAGYALIVVVAVLALYFGVRFINAVFNDVEKKQTTAVRTMDNGYNQYCYEVGTKNLYTDMAVCHALASEGKKMISSWVKP